MTNAVTKLNNTDKKILNELMKNARISGIELSKKTGVSRQTVNKTINRLEKNQSIWGYNTIFDIKTIDKKRFIMLLKTAPSLTKEKFLEILPTGRRELYELIGVIPIYLGILHGPYDGIVIFAADDIIQANKFMRLMKTKYIGMIDDIVLIEELMTMRSGGILNPNFDKELDKIL